MSTNPNRKVVLVVPPFSEDASMSAEESGHKVKEIRIYPPLGLAYLAGELLSRNVDCKIIDSAALMFDEGEAAEEILKKAPSVIGITVTSFSLKATYKLITRLKKAKPQIPIVIGGPHVTHWPDSVFELGADYGIRGDGEKSLSEMVEFLFQGEVPAGGIKGLVMKRNGAGSVNNGVATIQELDTLPFPSRNLLTEEKYIFVMSYSGRFTSVITSRGCIFDCIYCGLPHKKRLNIRSIGNIINELKIIASGQYEYVNFVDDCFTVDRDRVIELCNHISKNNLRIKWGCATRADYVDYELLKIMKEAGCYDIRFGVETGVDSIREFSIGKRIPDSIFEKSLQDAKRAGLITAGFFLFGHPGETIRDMRRTVHFAEKLNPHYAAFMLATPVPGSRLFDLSLKEGKLNSDTWRKVSVNQTPLPVYTPGEVTIRQMKALQARASVSFYLRPRNIILRLSEIKHPKELFFKLKIGTIFLIRSFVKSLRCSEIIQKIISVKYKRNMKLPSPDSLESLNIPVLDKHTRLIYHPVTGILYQKRFRMALSYLSGKKERILEAGCGRGLLLPELSRRCLKLYSIDIHNRLDAVQGTLQDEGVCNAYLNAASITNLPYRDGIFDTIICISVLEHITDLRLCFKEFSRVLKDSGEVIAGFPVKNRLTDLLLGFLNYNAAEVHPSGHRSIIEAAKEKFILENFTVYPKYLPVDYSLYFVGKFIKRNSESKTKEHFDRIAATFDSWKSKNSYYHSRIKRFHISAIPKGKRILEIGCATGDLLSSLGPEYGVGIDISENMIRLARQKYPHLNFIVSDVGELNTGDKFDYIILSNLLEYVPDCLGFFHKLKKFCSDNTKVIITNINPLWEPVMHLGMKLRLKTPDVQRNYITKRDVINMLTLCGYDIVEDGFRMLIPKRIFLLSDFLNKLFSRIPGVNNFCCMQYIIARDRPSNAQAEEFSCSVVIPCFNESENIEGCIARIPEMGKFTEIIIVDDGSSDGTAQIVNDIVKRSNNISLVRHPVNRGKAYAIKTGFEHARGDIVVILDADMTVPPEELPNFFYSIANGNAEFVNGTRMIYPMEKGAMRFINFLGNKMFGMILSLLVGQRNTDTLCGTKAILRKYCKYININSRWGDFDLLFGAAKLKLKTVEMPVHYKRRVAGNSKMKTIKDGLLFLKVCWHWFNELA